jgi:hypothetical protein
LLGKELGKQGSATDSKELNNLPNEFLLIRQMLSDMGLNSLSDPMSNKPLKHGGLTQDWKPLSNPMLDKPIGQNLFDMASDRIIQSHVGQACPT